MADLGVLRQRAFDAGYRMLGSRSEADDVAQEAMLRVREPLARGEVDNPEAYVTTVATRLAVDHLRSARVRRERYHGPWLPEPLVAGDLCAPGGPDGRRAVAGATPTAHVEDVVELADSLSYGLMVVLETLGPVERAAFLLHDVFGFDYGEVAAAVGRTEPACRQLVSRARARVAEGRPRLDVDPVEHRELLDRFLVAASGGDLDALVAMLAPDAVLVSDGGATTRAARHPVRGAERVARLLGAAARKWAAAGAVTTPVRVTGSPGFVFELDGRRVVVGTAEVVDGRITRLWLVLNPEKLGDDGG
jgi:RNA polymerase sigma-70 factor, ECF subfamily